MNAFRADRQGDAPDEARVERAMTSFVKDFGRTSSIYMESCIHCGQCAQACHYYEVSKDPRHTPIWKLEPFKQAYKREAGPFAFVHRLFNLKKRVSVQELEEWQELLYDTCTMCGRCTMACPMGIDIATLVGQARHAMFAAGLVPAELHAVAERAERDGSPLGATPKVFRERVEWLADDEDVEIPLDKPQAKVLCTMSSVEIMKYPQSVVATARVMNHLGLDWTFRTDGYEATNFGLLSGNTAWQKDMSMKLIDAAIACGAELLVLPECGHAYSALRWQGANMYGKPLPFRVLHMSEFLGEMARSGRLKLKPMKSSATFHDPCQVSRRGGAMQGPRDTLAALGLELREMSPDPGANWCCGGGGGVVTLSRANEMRHKVFQIKMRQVEATGADLLVSSCANCRLSFDDGQAHYKWDKKVHSLLEMVADQLVDQ
jgi:Fe-S oxidoreductase